LALSKRNAGVLVRPSQRKPRPKELAGVGRSSSFDLRQAAELDWWWQFLQHPTARARMYALYGARYLSFLWRELREPGVAAEFGSGPMPVLEITGATQGVAVDTLAKGYRELGLYQSALPLVASTDELLDNEFDTVLVLNVLDHSDDPGRLICEAWRVLKPQGKVLVFVHLGFSDDKHFEINVGECKRWLLGTGFEIVREAMRQPQPYDPPAFVCVARKR